MNKKELYERAKLDLTRFCDGSGIMTDPDEELNASTPYRRGNNILKVVQSSKPTPWLTGGRDSF